MKQLSYLGSLVRFAARENRLLFVSLILALASAAIEIAAMAVLMPMATAIGGQPPADSKVNVAFLWLGIEPTNHNLIMLFLSLLGLRIATQFASQALIVYLGRRLLLQLTTRAFSSVMWHVPVSTIEKRSIGYFITLTGDEASRGSTVIVSLTQFTTTAALGGMYFFAILSYSPMMAVLVVAFLLITLMALLESFRYSHKLGARQIEQSQSASSVLLDAINGVRSVRSFGAEKFVTDSYFGQIRAYVRTLALIDLVSISAKLAPAFLLVVIAAAFVKFGLNGLGEALTLPTIATLAVLLMRFFPIVGQALGLMLRVVSDIQAGQDITRAIKEFGAAAPAPANRSEAAPLKEIALTGLGFEHIAGVPVLANLTKSFRAGRSYAIVGSSGSGKSTLLDLILGIHEPTQGTISINGTASRNRKPADTRGRMILVSQETAIFNETVLGNIRLGSDAPMEVVEHACRIAHAHAFILDLPNSYQTLLSYRGSNLSGGQRQRIGIARAVLRQPDVVLLDESTSALDADTRDRVVDNLLREFSDKIIVFVTHDEAIMARVDEVIRLEPIGAKSSSRSERV